MGRIRSSRSFKKVPRYRLKAGRDHKKGTSSGFKYLIVIWGFPKIRGTLFGGPHNKDYSILGSILGSPYFGKLPYELYSKLLKGHIYGSYYMGY